ncbi:hypothetical protein F5B20DRAFT_480053 [Whalleya microplaca]|nr:hypothetical protein F5B20DRAFT_480053 [Whalleya microplaca]
MTSFIEAVGRLVLRRKPREGRMDEEHADNVAAGRAFGSTTAASTDGDRHSHFPPAHGHRSYQIPEDDSLTLFRLLLGINTSPYLGYTQSSPVGTRPAANIGIYARVVHSEQKAKDSFKVFSVVINACYFLQIVVAASLTAMGAANAGRGAITAFGAINTVIAGLLTFLKGSGLPGRFKYYGNEWKKIREYIEQRERDFSRVGCTLDVFEVVNTIDQMYNNTKREIEMNTPDSYTTITNQKGFAQTTSEVKVGGVEFKTSSMEVAKVDGLESKLQSLESAVERLTAGVEKKTEVITQDIHEHEKQIKEDVHDFKKTIIEDLEDHKAKLGRETKERRPQATQTVDEKSVRVMDEKDKTEQADAPAAKDAEDSRRTATSEVRIAVPTPAKKDAEGSGHEPN